MRIQRFVLVVLAGALAFLMISSATALAITPEAPVTEPASAVEATSALLNGELNPHASATSGYQFGYSTNGTCTEGNTTEPGPQQTGQSIKVSQPVTGLTPNTEYTFCAIATHLEGEVLETTIGNPLTFVTEAVKPVVTEESTSSVTPLAATLQAFVNPENQVTTACVFEYGTTSAYGLSAPCEPSTLEGAFEQFTSTPVAALEQGTTYHYRVVVANATGVTEGQDSIFTTPTFEVPFVAGESVSNISSTDATLLAEIVPSYQETTYQFEYATNEALTGATVAPGGTSLLGNGEPVSTSPVDLGGVLDPGTTYYFRVAASNGTGHTSGSIQHFTTQALPALTAAPAQDVTRTTASLFGSVNPDGAATRYYFAYIDQARYEAAVSQGASNPFSSGERTADVALPADYVVHSVGPLLAEELRPATTYRYALIATNSVGTVIGPSQSLTTPAPTPPSSTTLGVTGVNLGGATLNGVVDGKGIPTTMQFEFGTTPGEGSLVPATVTSSSGTVRTIATTFADVLQPGTTYYFRVVATNDDGTIYGSEQSFATPVSPASVTEVLLPLLPFSSIAEINAKEAAENTPALAPKPLTRSQKLAKALRVCGKKPKHERSRCERRAQTLYGARSGRHKRSKR